MYNTLLGRLDGFIGHLNESSISNEELRVRREIIYASGYATTADVDALNIARCSLAQKHVEVQVDCNGSECKASRMRESLTDTRPSTFTAFDHGSIMRNLALQFPVAVPSAFGSSPTEFFLSNTTSFPFVQQAGQFDNDVAVINLSRVTPEEFSERLSLVLNTYYQLTIQPTGYYGSLSRNLSRYGPDTAPATDINAYLPSNLSATNHSFYDWWAKNSQGGTTLDAMERARLLQDIGVHVGDVCGEEDIGHIAFGAGVPLRNLKKDRLYC